MDWMPSCVTKIAPEFMTMPRQTARNSMTLSCHRPPPKTCTNSSPKSTPSTAPNPISIDRRRRRSSMGPIPTTAATAAKNGIWWPRTYTQKP